MALTFRKAVPSERDDAERILWSAFTPYVRNLGREITADAYGFLAAAIDRGDIYLAVDGAEVVGVAPARQGTGLGSWLLVQIEEVARSIGARSLSLETAEIAEGNIRLYRRHGFEIVGRGLPAHGKDPHMRVHMVKPL